ncbi:MAG TPA: hypothetical protein VNT23_01150 [Gaiellaceae bacterium]|nr:hypothetical protein [Gaiellaceae bacterium]
MDETTTLSDEEIVHGSEEDPLTVTADADGDDTDTTDGDADDADADDADSPDL